MAKALIGKGNGKTYLIVPRKRKTSIADNPLGNIRGELLSSLGVTNEQYERMDEMDTALTSFNMYFSLPQLFDFILNGKGDPEEIAEEWQNALMEDFVDA